MQALYSLWCEQGAESNKTPHSHVELSSFVPSLCTCTSWRETERLNYGVSEFSEKSPSWCSTVLCGDIKEQLRRSFSHPLFGETSKQIKYATDSLSRAVLWFHFSGVRKQSPQRRSVNNPGERQSLTRVRSLREFSIPGSGYFRGSYQFLT